MSATNKPAIQLLENYFRRGDLTFKIIASAGKNITDHLIEYLTRRASNCYTAVEVIVFAAHFFPVVFAEKGIFDHDACF